MSAPAPHSLPAWGISGQKQFNLKSDTMKTVTEKIASSLVRASAAGVGVWFIYNLIGGK